MNRFCAFVLLLVSYQVCAQSSITISAPLVAEDIAKQHLVTSPPPVYPPIAQAAHVMGTVVLQIEISPDGHVFRTKIISGPPMLNGAAIDAVKKWVYTPFVQDGKPATVSTMISFPFELPKADPNDEKIAQGFFPLDQKCIQAVSQQASPAEQADACLKAAVEADRFSPDARFIERREAYVYCTTAFIRNQQLKEALIWANKAVAVVLLGHDDGSGSSAAYGVRGQAKAYSGDLTGADKDLATAEDFQRNALDTPAGRELHVSYARTLKGLLGFHAQVLTAMQRSAEAQTKLDEAAKL